MDGRQDQGGYERTSGGLGGDFISLGSNSGPDDSNQRWPRWNRRGRGRGIHQSYNRFERQFCDGPSQPVHSDNPQHMRELSQAPFYSNNPHHMREPSQAPFYSNNPHHMRGQNRGRGNQNFRGQQGPRNPKYPKGSDIPISAYYHPSMVEDPWEALENLLQGPKIEAPSSDVPRDDLDQIADESDDIDRPNSGDSDDSE
ncbi:uncharacterized protein LOC117649979 [Thrips palmi]|uniref:Uncharacterized protein LOC117649979 n=1 Tax=Thrips palmi TaxID=161013 RepID=A0A6P8ZW62_THRPL|nr:uncharacterized protein LOC117649979 [Thrips palmi]